MGAGGCLPPEVGDGLCGALPTHAHSPQCVADIGVMLNKVPRQMLLLFKANDCLRHLDRKLGASSASLIATARHTARALVGHARQSGSWVTYLASLADLALVELALASWSLRCAARSLLE